MIQIKMKGIIEVRPVIMGRHDLCLRPYPNHKNGCPNYATKKGCPPGAPMFDSFYDLSKSIYAIYNVFDFKGHVERMKVKHSSWSKRQVECCLYWQGTARKELKKQIEVFNFLMVDTRYSITTVPEAMGVNVTETMKNVGVELEWPPVNVAYQIAIAGILFPHARALA